MASWPSQKERQELSEVMQSEGFPGCIGFIDGTTIPLSQKPPVVGKRFQVFEKSLITERGLASKERCQQHIFKEN
jgi:hypothetical protein